MIVWKAYRLIFKAKSPIHIGSRKLGYIQKTRYYITGRNMWGAITSTLTRELFSETKEGANPKNYEDIGNIMRKDIVPGYFYPTIDIAKPLFPKIEADEINYGEFSEQEFERHFIHSYGQTGIESANLSAEENSLHETEYISPDVKIDAQSKTTPVYFVGLLFIKEKTTYNGKSIGWDKGDIKLSECIKPLFVGGERKYGFGWLELDIEKSGFVEDYFGYTFELNKETPIINVKQKKPGLAHIEIDQNSDINQFVGQIEPLVGREFGIGVGKNGHGQNIVYSGVYLIPGTIGDKEQKYTVEPMGIWKLVQRD